MNRLCKRHLIPAIVLMFISVPPAMAEMDIDGMIKYRQSVMKALGGHTGAINRLVRGQVPLMDQLEMHVTAARDIAQTVTTLFPADSIPPDAEFAGATIPTEALAAIGEQPEEFEKAAQKTIDATEQLVKMVQAGNTQELPLAFKLVGESCKGCHENFRKKKE